MKVPPVRLDPPPEEVAPQDPVVSAAASSGSQAYATSATAAAAPSGRDPHPQPVPEHRGADRGHAVPDHGPASADNTAHPAPTTPRPATAPSDGSAGLVVPPATDLVPAGRAGDRAGEVAALWWAHAQQWVQQVAARPDGLWRDQLPSLSTLYRYYEQAPWSPPDLEALRWLGRSWAVVAFTASVPLYALLWTLQRFTRTALVTTVISTVVYLTAFYS